MSSETSAEIRRRLLERRKALSAFEVERFSWAAAAQFLLHSGIRELALRGIRAGLYRALPFELNIHSLEPTLRELGWQLYFPRIVKQKDEKVIEFAEVPSNISPQLWTVGAYGIEEPHLDLNAVAPEKLDLIFVPGVAFGEAGQRIGMSKGFYDRFLVHAPKALRVALAFDFQVLPELPENPWDQRVHWIFTDKRRFQTPFVDEWVGRWNAVT